MDKEQQIFRALSEGTRRAIFDLLMDLGVSITISQLGEQFSMSRQAITKHIVVLQEAGLIDVVAKGRERFCYANPKALKVAGDWINQYQKYWNLDLSALKPKKK